MIATAHVIIGGAVGTAVGLVTQNPVTMVAAGVVSHFLCDLTPHLDHPPALKDKKGDIIWNRAVWIFAFTDSILSLIIVLIVWNKFGEFPASSPFVLGAIGGYLPDFIDNVPFWNKYTRPLPGFKQFHSFHEQIHKVWTTRYPMEQYAWLGITTQVVAVLVAILFLNKYI
jgi:hypothetical protein